MPETLPLHNPSHNQLAYSVSEISGALKRLVEDNFGQVRVRGELSGWKIATSGHAYLKLKDAGAVLDAVCWKGTCQRLAFKAEDGLEVICTGRLTTYPGRSNYQLVIERMEPAGLGALMALLEKRKAQLAAEGLFAPERKKPLPFMPRVIGVITSPTGAVIRDILHRLSDRFPCHVLVWPVRVQGEGAAEEIAAAIRGFNGSTEGRKPGSPEILNSGLPDFRSSGLPRPDLLIVARGGGSLEDLWAFNEEVVVRAAAESRIPLISAVGHETDTTLIDYVSDRRAPTPTAAAEMAVPVREEWQLTLMEHGKRLLSCALRHLEMRRERLMGLSRALPQPQRLTETAAQKLDDWSERLSTALPLTLEKKRQALLVAGAKLQPANLLQTVLRHEKDASGLSDRAGRMTMRLIEQKQHKLEALSQLLESVSPMRILERGFVLVKSPGGHIVTRAKQMQPGAHTLIFHDGETGVTA